jgi:hypothetical protein
MNLTSQQQTTVALVASHQLLLRCTSELFAWFQESVKGYSAEADFDAAVQPLTAKLEADTAMNTRLRNEWDAYTGSLRSAYSDFGRDVVHRMGVDEPAQVRNLALNIAAGALTRVKQRARDFLLLQLEA